MAAIRLATGERLWLTKPPLTPCRGFAARGANPAARAPAPGTGGPGRGGPAGPGGCTPGSPRRRPSFLASCSPVRWTGSCGRTTHGTGASSGSSTRCAPFPTINGVEGKGGGINGPGPVIAGGILYVNSGYGAIGGIPGNVLLAFARGADDAKGCCGAAVIPFHCLTIPRETIAMTTTTATRTYKIDKAHSEATFQVRYLLTKVRGASPTSTARFSSMRRIPRTRSIDVTIQATSIDTNEAGSRQAPAIS